MYRTTRSRTLPIPSTPTQQHHDLVFIKTTQRNIRYYILYDARLLHHLMSSIAKMYPDLVTLTTSQELYGLPGAGGEEGCPFYHEGGNNRGRDRRSLEERDDWDVVGGEEEGGFRRRVLRKVNRTKGPLTPRMPQLHPHNRRQTRQPTPEQIQTPSRNLPLGRRTRQRTRWSHHSH
mmetsp:Transcript_60962/g.72339  ORF Transcript_60962/g.72339 Transcript_60962/m.72339 type:complete len:176 (-) Transcript_60962:940-1467(-)